MEYKLHDAAQLRHSANPYADNYTGFIWNGHHSSDFNCFIENTGHLTFEPAPEFSNSNVTPAFYDGSIYTGTQVNSKKLQLNLVFYHLTLADFNRALAWLNYKKVSSFLLDYDPNWRYQCKLNSLGTVEKYVDGYCINAAHGSLKKEDLYICRMQASFETIDIHNAISTYGEVDYYYSHEQEITVTDQYNIIIEYAADEGTISHQHEIVPTSITVTDDPYIILNDQIYYFQSSGAIQIYLDNNRIFNCVYTLNNHLLTITNESYVFDENTEAGELEGIIFSTHQETVPVPIPNSLEVENQYSLPTTFRVHLSNFTNKQIVINQLAQDNENTVLIPICSIDLNLDDGQKASLHYDSKTGAVTILNCLINSLRNGNGDLLCNYCATLSNITIPAYGQIQLALSDDYNGEIMIEYDLQTSVI